MVSDKKPLKTPKINNYCKNCLKKCLTATAPGQIIYCPNKVLDRKNIRGTK